VNVAEQPIRAVDAGVMNTPAVAVDGRLAFPKAPSPDELREAFGTNRRRRRRWTSSPSKRARLQATLGSLLPGLAAGFLFSFNPVALLRPEAVPRERFR
jgi:hypothetical protein